MKPIKPINPSLSFLFAVPLHPLLAGSVHFFLDAAFFLEVALLPLDKAAMSTSHWWMRVMAMLAIVSGERSFIFSR